MSLVPLTGSIVSWPFRAAAGIGLSAISGWVVAGAEAMLREVVIAIGLVTTPSLSASWFSGTYWRVSALAILLTLPFLFAAAVQAIVRTDLGVLIRAAFVDLPVAMLGVFVAAPLITLLLAATDEMCTLVVGGGGGDGGSFLMLTATDLTRAQGGFLLVVLAVTILVAGMLLMIELIIRSAAIYVVVLFLPLGFAAMVWPARRIWIKRMAELLVALILSKFVMVAILALAVAGLASFASDGSSLSTALSAMALLILACLSPWALLRLLPFAELAASASSGLRSDMRHGISDLTDPFGKNSIGREAATGLSDFVADPLRTMQANRRGDSSDGHGQPGHDHAAAAGNADEAQARGPDTPPDASPQPLGTGDPDGSGATAPTPGRPGSDGPVVGASGPDGSPSGWLGSNNGLEREPAESDSALRPGSTSPSTGHRDPAPELWADETPSLRPERTLGDEVPFLAPDAPTAEFNLAEGQPIDFLDASDDGSAGEVDPA